MTVSCYIALGGNVGDVEQNFRAALSGLAATLEIDVLEVSPTFRTQPVGQWAGSEFLNAAARIDTVLEPLALLDILQSLEHATGPRTGPRWGPRALDLDLIFYGDRTIDESRLQIPHPACWYRRFVLDPLAAIAADFRHPTKDRTIAELQARLLRRPLRLSLAGATRTARQRLVRILAAGSGIEVKHWHDARAGEDEPEILAWLGPSVDDSELSFDRLPALPRLDVSSASDPLPFLRDVLHSALG
ncbi:MAG TPA: 2-amino-4-hydroxy-6-hydroxymethyldihydropteridine diphosphokinase [Planctomycetaceae bacterium]|jgi:2-amino-4-hydroxy-6-hydroxymethyldihydropteridine diphosphokinase|nr:2-amino-4-hydroxy-6-hydroxymethyldihydropteridine diphosphokinase [Planctomycetaceae bacterium]